MSMQKKMSEYMKGGMSEEKMKMMLEMMERFFPQAQAAGEAEEKTPDDKKDQEAGCCLEREKVMDLCSQMMGQFFSKSPETGGDEEKRGSGEKQTDSGCCPGTGGASDR